MFFRPTRLLVNLSAVEHNFQTIRAIVGSERKVCAVIKANGYGMGAVPLARTLAATGCDYFGVATLKEAAELRSAGITRPIVMLGALFGQDSLWEALLLDLDISIHHMTTMDDLARIDGREREKLRIHLKVDTGMSRLGLRLEQIRKWCDAAGALGIHPTGMFTTFSSSDQKENLRTLEQASLFEQALEILDSRGMRPPLIHAANSGAILNFEQTHLTMVRPGLLLHGVPSWHGPAPAGFRHTARLESEIIQLNDYPSGTPFGYSASRRVQRPTRAAVVPIGYADGLNRALSNTGYLLVRGRKAPIIGKVSMDLTILDVTDIPEAALGDTVTIIGTDGEAEITPWDMAKMCSSIPWEVFCWVGPRVNRVYWKDGEAV